MDVKQKSLFNIQCIALPDSFKPPPPLPGRLHCTGIRCHNGFSAPPNLPHLKEPRSE
jgi:hypothetical protein